MGQTPAKYFPFPTPYGQSPEMGVLQKAQAAAPAPLNNFLPLNSQYPSQAPSAQPQTQAGGLQSGFQGFPGQFGRFGGYQQMNRNMLT